MSTPASPSFKIVGGDGKEYGPIDLEALQQWAREGRVAGVTQVWDSRTGNWQPAAQIVELAGVFTAPPPTPAAAPVPGFAAPDIATAPVKTPRDPQSAVKAPAIFMLVVASIALGCSLLGILMNVFRIGFGALPSQTSDPVLHILSGTLGLVLNVVGIPYSVLIIIGSVKMKSLESYAWSMTAAILTMLPLNGCCCGLGLAAGIWSLVVLNDPVVKAAFKR